MKFFIFNFFERLFPFKGLLAFCSLVISMYSFSQVGIDVSNPAPYSAVEIGSNLGFRIPQLNHSRRDLLDDIANSATNFPKENKNGLMIYNVDTKCLNVWIEDKWVENCGRCIPMSGNAVIIPSNPTLIAGQGTQFEVTGLSHVTWYQWYVDNTIVSGATSPTFIYTPAAGTNSVKIGVATYGCDYNFIYTTTSDLFVCTPVSGNGTITPSNPILTEGQSTQFSVNGFNNVTSYQWYVNGSAVTGANSSTFNYTPPTGTTSVIISVRANGCNNSYLEASTSRITVNPGCIPVSGNGTITPSNPTLIAGQSTQFTVSGFNNVTSYQWYVNGSTVSGATSSTYTYTPAAGTSSATIMVRAYGCNNSSLQASTANISVCTPVSGNGTITPSNPSLTVGQSTQFTVSGFNNVTSYQWYVNGSAVSGATSSTYTYTPAAGTSSATIMVRAYGCNNSSLQASTANISVCTPVAGGSIGSSTSTITPGSTVTFSAIGFTNVTGGYRWSINGVIQPSTSSTVNYAVPASATSAISVSVTANGCNNSTRTITSNFSLAVCDLSSSRITMSAASIPIRPVTSDNYYGARFDVTGLPSGASVTGWKVVNASNSVLATGYASSAFYFKPASAPTGSHPITVTATVRCSNGLTKDLTYTTSYGSVCTTAGGPLGDYTLYPGGSGYIWCYRSGNEFREEGKACASGWVFNPSERGCVRQW